MNDIFMASVGDGLCLGVRSCLRDFRGYAQLDWGGETQKMSLDGYLRMRAEIGTAYDWRSRYFVGPREFVLSHYHLDHYAGLVAAANSPNPENYTWAPQYVYFPGIPQFESAPEFYLALFAFNAYMLGDSSGSMDYDLLRAVQTLCGAANPGSGQPLFQFKALFEGDVFWLGGQLCTAVWPPRKVVGAEFSTAVANALEKFDVACNVDKELREVHERIQKRNLVGRFLEGHEDLVQHLTLDEIRRETRQSLVQRNGQSIPKEVEEANVALRKAANYLSLGFYSSNELLFLGDVAPKVTPQIVDKLLSAQAINYRYLIAPHHGTYWEKSMASLRANNVLISNGRRLVSKYKTEWATVGSTVYSSFINGDTLLLRK